MKKTRLTTKKLDRIWSDMTELVSGKQYTPRLSKTAPRYEYRTKKLPRKEALIRKARRIADALDDLQMAMDAPLETMEQVYVTLKPGSKAWKKFRPEPVFPLIISKEASDAILAPAKNKKGRK